MTHAIWWTLLGFDVATRVFVKHMFRDQGMSISTHGASHFLTVCYAHLLMTQHQSPDAGSELMQVSGFSVGDHVVPIEPAQVIKEYYACTRA